MISRIISVVLFLTTLFISESHGQSIQEADSLFANQKYTEAYQTYEQIFSNGEASPAMLLRMAFIQDGLGHYVDALYLLDLYYQLSADKSVVGKIEEISAEYALEGYVYNDMHFFAAIVNRFHTEIRLLLLVLSGLLVAYIFRKRQQNEKPITASVFQLVILIGFLFISNKLYETPQGIILSDQTLLRSGPSAGAETVSIAEKGHKVKVIEQSQVWSKVDWNGEIVFVRNGKIRII